MFDIASSEFLLVALIALLVIGPKDLPNVLRFVGKWMGKARSVAAQFRSGMDEMVRQAELKDLEKKWEEENQRIMREFPSDPVAEGARQEADSAPVADESEEDKLPEAQMLKASDGEEPELPLDIGADGKDKPS